MSYRVVIPTAGTGSRLNGLTKYINKSLVGISNRPAISHLIEQFPDDCEFVIALGHKGNLLRDFLELAYPERTFFFAQVDPYDGDGSGLGLSLLACEQYLQQPFIFYLATHWCKARYQSQIITGWGMHKLMIFFNTVLYSCRMIK